MHGTNKWVGPAIEGIGSENTLKSSAPVGIKRKQPGVRCSSEDLGSCCQKASSGLSVYEWKSPEHVNLSLCACVSCLDLSLSPSHSFTFSHEEIFFPTISQIFRGRLRGASDSCQMRLPQLHISGRPEVSWMLTGVTAGDGNHTSFGGNGLFSAVVRSVREV